MDKIIMVLMLLGVTTPAYAYLDPGTGSMLVSMIVGIIASAWFAFKGFFYKIKNIFKKNNHEEEQNDNNSST